MYPSPTSVGMSTDESPESEIRKRTARACDSCYKRKIKCDASIPCNWCSHHNIPCTFERNVRRKKKPKVLGNGQQSSADLTERINRLEKLLAENLSREQEVPGWLRGSPVMSTLGGITPPALLPASSSLGALHFAGHKLGATSWITGIPFLHLEGRKWIEARTGQPTTLDRLNRPHPPWESRRMSSNALTMTLPAQSAFELPEKCVVQTHFDFFRLSVAQAIFPIVDPILFAETIETAYQQPQLNFRSGYTSTRACIFAFLSFVSLLSSCGEACREDNRARLGTPVDSEAFVAKAQCLLPQILQESASLEGMQTVIILCLFELLVGNLQSGSYFGSIAARFIFVLGAHTADPATMADDPDLRKKRHLRNLFWLLYVFDKDMALRTGQPQLLPNENCDLTLPPGYVESLHNIMALHEQYPQHYQSPTFPIDLRLSIIKSRTYSALYSFHSLQKTDAELLKEIRELDDELERWRISMPPQLRPTMSYSQDTPLDPNPNMHTVMLRFNYYLCMTFIHQASSRCNAWAKDRSVMLEGVSSSLALSVEASRSTLMYFRAAEHVLIDEAFWGIIFYPMSALICIFCNILQYPLDPRSRSDFDLLKSTNGMLERVFTRRSLVIHDIVNFNHITDFVTELHWLAKCAIEKAWNERGCISG